MKIGHKYDKLLIHGYMRENIEMPNDVILIIIKFYINTLRWILQNDEYKTVYNINGPQWEDKNLSFSTNLQRGSNNKAVFNLTMSTINVDIDYCSILVQMQCEETKHEKKIKIKRIKCKKDETLHTLYLSHWSHIKSYKQLTFILDYEILFIQYKNNVIEPYVIPIKLDPIDAILKYEWRIDDVAILNDMKQYIAMQGTEITNSNGRYWAPDQFGMDDTFILYIDINCQRKKGIKFGLKLLKYPFNVEKVQIEYVTKLDIIYKNNHNDDSWGKKGKYMLYRDMGSSTEWISKILNISMIENVSYMNFYCEFKIISIQQYVTFKFAETIEPFLRAYC